MGNTRTCIEAVCFITGLAVFSCLAGCGSNNEGTKSAGTGGSPWVGGAGGGVTSGIGGETAIAGATGSGGSQARLVAKSVSAGQANTCALLTDGTIRCWGEGHWGTLGNGSTKDSSVPVVVSGIANAVAIAVGVDHACALLEDGTIQCWGHGIESLVPKAVPGIANAVAITAVGSTDGDASPGHDCALLRDRTVMCWGENTLGQLGDGTEAATTAYSPVPVVVSGVTNAIAVAASMDHTDALFSDGTIWQWGRYGFGTATTRAGYTAVPVPAAGITDAVGVVGGNGYTCALWRDGTARCWGVGGVCLNNNVCKGTLASSEDDNIDSAAALPVLGLTDAVALSGGVDYTCALLAGGTIQCWGKNQQNGNFGGTLAGCPDANCSVVVPGIVSATAVSVGRNHACAVLNGGSVQCWGDSSQGQLGDGVIHENYTFRGVDIPVTVSGF
jgi:alpha-tubulin suppressor-like RCC1 family protein